MIAVAAENIQHTDNRDLSPPRTSLRPSPRAGSVRPIGAILSELLAGYDLGPAAVASAGRTPAPFAPPSRAERETVESRS